MSRISNTEFVIVKRYFGEDGLHPTEEEGASADDTCAYTHTARSLKNIEIKTVYTNRAEADLHCFELNKLNPCGNYGVCPRLLD